MGVTQNDFYEITAITAGKDQTLALLKSGEVLGWGGAGSGRITPLYVDICKSGGASAEPVYITNPSLYSDISAGYGLSLGVSNQAPFIWGFCQTGTGGKELFSEAPSLIGGIPNAVKVSAGQFLFAAIDQSGSVYTWGLNIDGALGRLTSQTNAFPALVDGLAPIRDIALGDNFMLALTRDDRIYVWGSSSAGQLGLGHLNTVERPEPVSLSARVKTIAVGSTHVLVITADGGLYGWGSNHFGQLGNNRHAYFSKPIPIALPEAVLAVAAGMHYSLALTSSGKVYAWGWNGCGQLGLGDLQSRSAPALIPNLSGVRAIAAGEMHSLAIGKNHLLGWGGNTNKQIGNAAEKQMRPYAFLKIA